MSPLRAPSLKASLGMANAAEVRRRKDVFR